MLVVGDKVRIPRREIVLRFVRSSGPGGQNVQKVASKVVLRWSVVGSPSLAADVRRRFLSRFASRITAEGDLVLACDRHRERERNRVDCLDRLANMLTEVSAPPTPRRRTRAPRRAAERRLKDKRMRAETKRDRRPVH